MRPGTYTRKMIGWIAYWLLVNKDETSHAIQLEVDWLPDSFLPLTFIFSLLQIRIRFVPPGWQCYNRIKLPIRLSLLASSFQQTYRMSSPLTDPTKQDSAGGLETTQAAPEKSARAALSNVFRTSFIVPNDLVSRCRAQAWRTRVFPSRGPPSLRSEIISSFPDVFQDQWAKSLLASPVYPLPFSSGAAL